MSKTKENELLKKVVIKEILRFLLFTIVMIAIYTLIASVLPLGIYWYWLN